MFIYSYSDTLAMVSKVCFVFVEIGYVGIVDGLWQI